MKPFRKNRFILAVSLLLLAFSVFLPFQKNADAATMKDYCVMPPYITQIVPPLVMLETGRDHKFYYEAYNDAFDLDDDGRLDRTYKHTIDYYGYFDPYKCYTYGSGQFAPVSETTDKFCSAGRWSGNVMNWLTMLRMDVLKKVLYGGDRITDTTTQTVLQRAIIPGDAHSVGKELTGRLCYNGSDYTYGCTRDSDCESGETCVDKSNQLIGIAAATEPFDCSFTGAITWTTHNSPNGKVRISRYYHSSALSSDVECADDTVIPTGEPVEKHNNLISSFEPETSTNFIDTQLVDTFSDDSPNILNPNSNHYDNYNILAVADFNVASGDRNKTWQFLVDSDDPAEVEIGVAPSTATGPYSGGSLVATFYGPCHSNCPAFDVTTPGASTPALCDTNQLGNYVPGSSGWHRLIVRQSESAGVDGVRVWYRKSSSDNWKPFPQDLTTRTPNVPSGAECTIQSNQYVQYGMPQVGIPARQHLFCNTQLSAAGVPTLRMATNSQYRKWQWASKENPVCQGTVQQGTSDVAMDVPIVDRTVSVEVCKASPGYESNCRAYKDNASTTLYKPAGLLQKYGEGDGSKVCSKLFTKPCASNSDCNSATEGFCIDKAPMYYGLMSTSYAKNTSGGILRKNFGSLSDEINKFGSTNLLNGIFSTTVTNGIIKTFEAFSGTVGYRFSDWTYQDATGGTCGWITNAPIAEGQCREWGNPIGEMMYESLRYFAGAGSATSAFDTASPDSGISLPHPSWGYSAGCASPPCKPYEVMPSCARPFMLVLSDEYTSFDDDQLPGSGIAVGSPFPQLNVKTLADAIGTAEGIAGHNWFIGESGTTNDFICSSKSVSNLSNIKGLCPMEPTKRGSYYSSAVAYYGKTKMKDDTTKPNADTFVVALTSPLADLRVKAGSNTISIVPLGKSISGSASVRTNCYNKCSTGATWDNTNGLRLGTCTGGAFCPTNQIVDLYVDDIRYDAGNNVVYASYRINFEDVEQGADHDMDTVVQYEVCTADAVTNNYGTCGTESLGANEVEVKVSNVYGKGGIDQILGFVISGTTADGAYLVIKDGDVSAADTDTPALVAGMPLSWSRTFTASGSPAGILKSPLWYAAKWGGFEDIDGDGIPFTNSTCGTASPNVKCLEWDKDSDGVPDNYFLVVNPLKLEDQLEKALLSILRRASSGTAASVLASGEGSGANLVQAIFYPKRLFNKEIDWTGSLQNLWYYVDQRLTYNSIREDTADDNSLKINEDYIINFFFDEEEQKTKAHRFAGNADGTKGAPQDDAYLEGLGYLWEAGGLLHKRTTSRTIKTQLDGSTLIDFNTGNAGSLRPSLQAADLTEAQNIIRYVRGESDIDSELYRNRTVTYNSTAGIWKLGDIVSSTPRVVSWIPLNSYHTAFKDPTYKDFVNSSAYINRGKVISNTAHGSGYVFTGANDGMLHAFKLGALEIVNDNTTEKASLKNADMGEEAWTYIPKNSLPYLKYLMDKDYCHLYYVDATPVIFDASIGDSSVTGSYWDETKTVDSWRTILIGGMRLGGACKAAASTYGVQAPLANEGYSSYFALDVTDPANPILLWEFSRPVDNDLGFTTTGPTIIKINGRDTGTGESSVNKNKNGRWFAVFSSGPTGPITTSDAQFKGFSDQNLKLFVVDLKTGAVARVIDTGKQNAFGGSLNNANIDYDMDYQDDAAYIGYTQAETNPPVVATKWTQGGVIRLVTKEDLNGADVTATGNTALNPGNWEWSNVMTGIGPVTSSIGHLAHYASSSKTPDKAWLFYGSGRYFYRDDNIGPTRALYGVKEKCLTEMMAPTPATPVCDNSHVVTVGELDNVSTSFSTTESENGWFITMDASERVVTDPLAATTGGVFFTSFIPSADICEYGGSSYLWALKYDTGGEIASSLKGTIILQVSTGVIEEVSLKTGFTEKLKRRTPGMPGMPPTGPGFALISQPPPVKRVLHMRER